MSLQLKGKSVNGTASLDLDEKNVQAHMLEYIEHKPYTAKPLGIRIKNKMPDMEDVARVAKDRLFVKIRLV